MGRIGACVGPRIESPKNMYEVYTTVRLVLVLVVAVVAFTCWSRSRRSGFVCLGVAFAIVAASSLLFAILGILVRSEPSGRGPLVLYLLNISSVIALFCEIAFVVSVLLGVLAFYAESASEHARLRPGLPVWRSVTLQLRRLFFHVAGWVLIIVGPIVVLRGGSTVGANPMCCGCAAPTERGATRKLSSGFAPSSPTAAAPSRGRS